MGSTSLATGNIFDLKFRIRIVRKNFNIFCTNCFYVKRQQDRSARQINSNFFRPPSLHAGFIRAIKFWKKRFKHGAYEI